MPLPLNRSSIFRTYVCLPQAVGTKNLCIGIRDRLVRNLLFNYLSDAIALQLSILYLSWLLRNVTSSCMISVSPPLLFKYELGHTRARTRTQFTQEFNCPNMSVVDMNVAFHVSRLPVIKPKITVMRELLKLPKQLITVDSINSQPVYLNANKLFVPSNPSSIQAVSKSPLSTTITKKSLEERKQGLTKTKKMSPSLGKASEICYAPSKPDTFPIIRVEVGDWVSSSVSEGDLVSEIDYYNKTFKSQMLINGLKHKIEFRFDDIIAINHNVQRRIARLEVELARAPQFLKEVESSPLMDVKWTSVPDFTRPQSSIIEGKHIHKITFPRKVDLPTIVKKLEKYDNRIRNMLVKIAQMSKPMMMDRDRINSVASKEILQFQRVQTKIGL